jgi:hypothetical protein
VHRVPLVVRRKDVLLPEPLDDRALHQTGRGIGVVLQQLGRSDAVITEIEPPVEIRISPPPRGLDGRRHPVRQPQYVIPACRHDMVHGLEAHLVQVLDHLLQRQHLVHLEHVVHRLVPVGPGEMCRM